MAEKDNRIYEGYQPLKSTLNPKAPPKNASLKPVPVVKVPSASDSKK